MGASSVTGVGVGDVAKRIAYAADTRQPNNSFNYLDNNPRVIAANSSLLDGSGNKTIVIPFWGLWQIDCSIDGVCQVMIDQPHIVIATSYNALPEGHDWPPTFIPITYTWEVLSTQIETVNGFKRSTPSVSITFSGLADKSFSYIVSTTGTEDPINPNNNFI